VTEHLEEKSGILTHYCTNVECPGQIAALLTYIADRTLLEIDSLGDELAAALARGGYVKNLADLFEFVNDAQAALDKVGPERFAAGMNKKGLGGAAMVKMTESAERSKYQSWTKWLASFSIPTIGLTLSGVLAKEMCLQADELAILPSRLIEACAVTIEGIGPIKKEEIAAWANSPRSVDLCKRLHAAGVRPAPVEQPKVAAGAPLVGTTFVITGEIYSCGSRPVITAHLERLGAVGRGSVSKKTNLLIVGAEPGQTKLTKAKELGIRMVDAEWVENVFRENGIAIGDNTDWIDEL
jgi:DNA ligase (NAD+)